MFPNTHGRVFNNSNATNKWVAKHVVAKMKSTSGDVKITDIMANTRSTYSTGITMHKAWRAKAMANEILDGDATKQYLMLWSYAIELRNANRGRHQRVRWRLDER